MKKTLNTLNKKRLKNHFAPIDKYLYNNIVHGNVVTVQLKLR